MITPSLDELLKQVDSKYTLVIVAAKRAREIIAQSNNSGKDRAIRAVSLSLEDIADGIVVPEYVERNH